jgi:hypothetical protein
MVLAIAFWLLPQAAMAVITFTQIDDDVFLVSHRVKVVGSRGKATKMVYTKAASLCVAAGFSHLRVLSQESEAAQGDEAENASLRVKLFFEDGADRIRCEATADPEYVGEAKDRLRKISYRPAARPMPGAAAPTDAPVKGESTGTSTGTCTLEQIAAMARTGLSDDRIRAACSAGS